MGMCSETYYTCIIGIMSWPDVKYKLNPHPHRYETTKFNQASRLKTKRG